MLPILPILWVLLTIIKLVVPASGLTWIAVLVIPLILSAAIFVLFWVWVFLMTVLMFAAAWFLGDK